MYFTPMLIDLDHCHIVCSHILEFRTLHQSHLLASSTLTIVYLVETAQEWWVLCADMRYFHNTLQHNDSYMCDNAYEVWCYLMHQCF